jgi:PIN domain nuclease of toxin-antitoxin system
LDASAVLAAINDEDGAASVARLADPAISAVNLAEVVAKLGERGMPEGEIRQAVGFLDARVIPFEEHTAYRTGLLRRSTKGKRLSLADRACLATAALLGVPVITADREWARLKIGTEVRIIR